MSEEPRLKQQLLAELLGTFGIVFAPVALSAAGKLAGGDSSLAAAAWASGLSVTAMIVAFGHVSGAHFNPAVTLGFAAAGTFPWRLVMPYALVQVLGAVIAAAITALVFGRGMHGTHIPAATAAPLACLGLEIVLSCLLMLLILAVATDPRGRSPIAPLAIGLLVVFLVWIGGPLTGGSMNPARSLGPALVSGGAALPVVWLYLLGPCLGTALATRLYATLRC